MESLQQRRSEFIAHASTYHRFMLGVKWAAIHLATIIVFLTVWFCSPGGFWGGLVSGAVVFAACTFAMKAFLAHSTETDPPGLPPPA